jgi:hypothetical protein
MFSRVMLQALNREDTGHKKGSKFYVSPDIPLKGKSKPLDQPADGYIKLVNFPEYFKEYKPQEQDFLYVLWWWCIDPSSYSYATVLNAQKKFSVTKHQDFVNKLQLSILPNQEIFTEKQCKDIIKYALETGVRWSLPIKHRSFPGKDKSIQKRPIESIMMEDRNGKLVISFR